jgi:hypothetical protein
MASLEETQTADDSDFIYIFIIPENAVRLTQKDAQADHERSLTAFWMRAKVSGRRGVSERF